MKFRPLFIVGSILLASCSHAVQAQDFRPYPGSKLDEAASREGSAAVPGKESRVYTTSDAFDKVSTFYKGLYKEIAMPGMGPKLPSGEQIKWAFFTIDAETSLATSKHWMKVQRPYVGGADGKDIREITVIQIVRTK